MSTQSAATTADKQTTTSLRSIDSAPPVAADWLSPLSIDEPAEHEVRWGNDPALMRRASNDGSLDLTLDEYIQLVDTAGRKRRRGKRGQIPSELPPILDRLGLGKTSWVELTENFGKLFATAAGIPERLEQEAKRRGNRWLQGIGNSRRMFRQTHSN